MSNLPRKRLPEWLRKPMSVGSAHNMKTQLRASKLHTVCEAAKCPNMCECFARKTATFMIMGDVCTRNCRFCAVKHGDPSPLDNGEPERVAQEIAKLGLRHAVVTSVTRDDLSDHGAGHFSSVIKHICKLSPETTIEVLTPDFDNISEHIKTVCDACPHVFNHNIETVERLTPDIRSRAEYRRSLDVLGQARALMPSGLIKSGIMVGLGETDEEVYQTLQDLRSVGTDMVTIGQYLRPNLKCIEVDRFVEPKVFGDYEAYGSKIGFKYIFSGPFVRSSYLADKVIGEIKNKSI